MARLLLALVFGVLSFTVWADTTDEKPQMPRTGDRFCLHVDATGALRAGEVFKILDDRYSDISLKAKVVEIYGDVALVEIVSGAPMPPAASRNKVSLASSREPG